MAEWVDSIFLLQGIAAENKWLDTQRVSLPCLPVLEIP